MRETEWKVSNLKKIKTVLIKKFIYNREEQNVKKK